MTSLPPDDPSQHEAFVSLYVRHEAAVFSFVLAMVKHTADAEDIVQRASMTMWRNFERFEPGTNFRAWAFQIAKNEALNHLSKSKRDRHVFSEKLIANLLHSFDIYFKKDHYVSIAYYKYKQREGK